MSPHEHEHEDDTLLNLRQGYTFIEPLQYLTCWVALTDTNADNGCPWFIPQLHRRGPMEHDFDEENG